MDDKNKYNDALEKLQEALAPKDGCEISGLTKGCIEEIFPELKELEDEKIRKSIIKNLKGNMYRADGDYDLLNKQISWFEKQGEKPQGKTALEAVEEEKVDNANKVEPKFKVGDWIVDKSGFVQQVLDFRGGIYTCTYNSFTTDCESNYHLWTIEDAKDGDVLVSDNIIFIFNRIHDIWIKCHCSLYEDDSFYGGDFDLMHVKYGKEVFPATKEQRDKLLKAMANAGWTFDFEKKELKELKKIEQNSAWSEEDEQNLKRAIWYVENPALNVVKDIMLSEWLKSIKERIYYKKKLIDIIDKAAEWWLIHDSYSKDTNNLVNDFKKDLLKYVNISE